MKILFVAMSDSIHTARWISLISDQEWELALFPNENVSPRPEFTNITIFDEIIRSEPYLKKSVKMKGFWPFKRGKNELLLFSHFYYTRNPTKRVKKLIKVIKKWKPDIIHSLEFQHAGTLVLKAKQIMEGNKNEFPKWIATNWGSDIYLFGKLPETKEDVKAILISCDYYSCECQRDIKLAQDMGLTGKVLPVLPNAGGFYLQQWNTTHFIQPDQRKQIILKGYQGWAGRALFGLKALEFCKEDLIKKNLSVYIYKASEEVRIAAELFTQRTGIKHEIIGTVTHKEMLSIFAKSRIYIGLSISDAISTSLLEAIATGAFPIQSDTSCAEEWITHGETGFIVPPEDCTAIVKALKIAINDDTLILSAARLNRETAKKRLDNDRIIPVVVDTYNQIMNEIVR